MVSRRSCESSAAATSQRIPRNQLSNRNAHGAYSLHGVIRFLPGSEQRGIGSTMNYSALARIPWNSYGAYSVPILRFLEQGCSRIPCLRDGGPAEPASPATTLRAFLDMPGIPMNHYEILGIPMNPYEFLIISCNSDKFALTLTIH